MLGKKGKKIFVIITIISSVGLIIGTILPYILYSR